MRAASRPFAREGKPQAGSVTWGVDSGRNYWGVREPSITRYGRLYCTICGARVPQLQGECPIRIPFLFFLLLLVVRPAGALSLTTCAGGPPTQPLSLRPADAAARSAARTVSGQVTAVTLFARFADEDSGVDLLPSWTSRIFDIDQPGSLSHYYRQMSQGQFDLVGHVVPIWFTARQPASYYIRDVLRADAFGHFGEFVHDILDAADPVVDFARFDNDGPDGVPNSGDDDGYVDFIFVNTRSTPTGFIRGPATGVAILGIRSDYRTDDTAANGGQIRIRKDEHHKGIGGITQRASTHAEAVGTMAHEFGHALGLPDLFDLSFLGEEDAGEDDSGGIGYWGLMGHGNRGWDERGGPTPFCAWSLETLGWIGEANERLVTVDDRLEEASLRDPRDDGFIYRLPSRQEDLYYLIEYRSPDVSYYDRFLPKKGALIWQVNAKRSGNDNEDNKLVDLICADGLYADQAFPGGREPSPFLGGDNLDFWAHSEAYRNSHAGNLGDATDPFDGVIYREFSPVSNPASRSGLSVKLRQIGDALLADFNVVDRRWTGVIDEAVVWQDTVVLAADVTVDRTGRLTIRPGTVILAGTDLLASGEDPSRTELIVGGELRSGSTSGDPVIFTSAAHVPQPGDWFGVRILASGLAKFENTSIEYGVSGVHSVNATRPLLLAQVRVDHSLADGIVATGLHTIVTAREIDVSRSGGYGLMVSGGGELRVEDGRFVANTAGGIRRRGGPADPARRGLQRPARSRAGRGYPRTGAPGEIFRWPPGFPRHRVHVRPGRRQPLRRSGDRHSHGELDGGDQRQFVQGSLDRCQGYGKSGSRPAVAERGGGRPHPAGQRVGADGQSGAQLVGSTGGRSRRLAYGG